jgi:two-component system, NarL family, response regulator NreC
MNLLLADQQPMFRDAMRALLEREGHCVIAETGDGRDAVRLARECTPDVALLEVGMPLMNGIDAARQIGRRAPGTATLLLTASADHAFVLDALRAGVRGYVLKTQNGGDLLSALDEVARGALYLSPGISQTVVDACFQPVPAEDPLTERERQVLQLIAEGHSTREVAALLAVSVKTAESHRSRLMSKLDLHNIAGLVRYAIRRGLIEA